MRCWMASIAFGSFMTSSGILPSRTAAMKSASLILSSFLSAAVVFESGLLDESVDVDFFELDVLEELVDLVSSSAESVDDGFVVVLVVSGFVDVPVVSGFGFKVAPGANCLSAS